MEHTASGFNSPTESHVKLDSKVTGLNYIDVIMVQVLKDFISGINYISVFSASYWRGHG